MHIYNAQQAPVCQPLTPAVTLGLQTKVGPAQLSRQGSKSLTAATDTALSQLATAAMRQQHYPQALDLLSELIDRHPHGATHYSNRGLVYLRLGQLWNALADCDRAVDLEPGLAQAYNNRAMCYAALGDIDAALNDYDYAVDINPFNSRARINLGATLRQMGDFDRALDCFDEALLFHQLPEFIYAERGRTYHLRGDWNCALADYRRALAAVVNAPPNAQQQALVQRVEGWMADLIPQPS